MWVLELSNTEEKRERQRIAARKYYYSKKGQEAHRRKNSRYYFENKEKKQIRARTRYLVKIGGILPQTCKVCGLKAEPHHFNYESPYNVEWYCRGHHLQHHYGLVD